MNEHDDIERELRETRAEPTPEFARTLDERAAGWLRERPRRRMPSLRIAIPALGAAATAAVVIAIAVSGGGGEESGSQLEVAVVADRGAAEALSGGSRLDLQKDSAAPRAAEGAFAEPRQTDLEEGEAIVARYFFTAATDARIEFAGRKATLRIPEGAGRIAISTDGIPVGAHELVITVRSMPPLRQRIEIRR